MTTRQYARLVAKWIRGIGLDSLKYPTSKAALAGQVGRVAEVRADHPQ